MDNVSGFSAFHITISEALNILRKQYEVAWGRTNQEIMSVLVNQNGWKDERASILDVDRNALYSKLESLFPYQELCILIVLTSCSLLESCINWYLATSHSLPNSEIKQLANAGLFKRWIDIPQEYIPEYTVPDKMKEDLEKLIQSRNAIHHHRPEIEFKDGSKIDGNIKNIFMNNNEVARQAFSLPWQLTENLVKFVDRKHRHIVASSFYPIISQRPNFKGISLE